MNKGNKNIDSVNNINSKDTSKKEFSRNLSDISNIINISDIQECKRQQIKVNNITSWKFVGKLSFNESNNESNNECEYFIISSDFGIINLYCINLSDYSINCVLTIAEKKKITCMDYYFSTEINILNILNQSCNTNNNIIKSSNFNIVVGSIDNFIKIITISKDVTSNSNNSNNSNNFLCNYTKILNGHTKAIVNVLFISNINVSETKIISTSEDKTIRIWNSENCISCFTFSELNITSIIYIPELLFTTVVIGTKQKLCKLLQLK